jgi:hypothetical protein
MYLFPGVSAYQTQGPWFPTSRRRTVGTPTEEEMDAAMERRKAQKADAEARVQRWTKASMEDDKAIKAEFDAEIATAKAEAMAAAAATEGKDHRLQVIVKLANIHLTPENPRYEGGSWHFEGVLNEHICATALYYYDADNVTESRLAFRSISDSEGYSEGDFE